MASSFGKNIIFLLFVNLLIKPLYIFGIETQAQNMLGPNTWGIYFGLFNFCFLFQIILDPGIHNQNSKWIAENRGGIHKRIGQTIALKLILGIFFLALMAIGAFIIGYPIAYFRMLLFLGINFFLSSLYVFLKSHFPAMGEYQKETFYSILDKVLLLILLGYQIYILERLDIMGFIYSITIANVIAIVVAYLGLTSLSPVHLRFSFSEATELLRKSFGFALVGLFMSMYNRLDGVMLERMLDDRGYSAGVYAACYRILDASNMFALLFASLLLPMFAHQLIRKDEIYNLVSQASRMMLAIISGVVLCGFFYAEEIMSLLYTDYTTEYSQSFKILILSFIGVGLSYVYGTLITASGKLFYFNLLLFAGILLNVTLNYLWIPTQTTIGAAKATLITQLFVMLGQLLIVVRQFGFRYNGKATMQTLSFLVIAIGSAYLLDQFDLFWVIRLILTGFILILASFLLGLLRLDTFFGSQTKENQNHT